MSFYTSFIGSSSSVNPSLRWSLGNGGKGYIVIEFPFKLNDGWYGEQPCTKFRTFQHRKERRGLRHEFIVLNLNNGRVCRVERIGDPNARLNALITQGSVAHDLVQCFESEDEARLETSELISEITLPCDFEILDVLKICRAIKEGEKTSNYTLRVYNCYFFSLAIQACLTRFIAYWEDKECFGVWLSQVKGAVDKLAKADQGVEALISSPHNHVLFRILSVLDPCDGQEPSIMGDIKWRLQLQLKGVHQDLEYRVNNLLWYSNISPSLNEFFEEKAKEVVLDILQERLTKEPTSAAKKRPKHTLPKPDRLKQKPMCQPSHPTARPLPNSMETTCTKPTQATASADVLINRSWYEKQQVVMLILDGVEFFLRVLHFALLGVWGITLFTFEIGQMPCVDIEQRLEDILAELGRSGNIKCSNPEHIIKRIHALVTDQHAVWNRSPWNSICHFIKDHIHARGNILESLEESKPMVAARFNKAEVAHIPVSDFQQHIRGRIQMQAKEVERYWLDSAENVQLELLETVSQVWKMIREDTSIYEKVAIIKDKKASTLHGAPHIEQDKHLDELSELEKVIESHSRALAQILENHPDLSYHLIKLGASHSGRFRRVGELSDLEKAIEYEYRALELTPDGHPELSDRFINLGVSCGDRFERLGDLGDLEKAIEYKSRALALTPDGHPHLPSRLASLGASQIHRFEHLGDLDDLEKAIECQSHALALTPDGHPDLPSLLANLGGSHRDRFKHLGDLTALDKAIGCGSRALALTPDDHPTLPIIYCHLATSQLYLYFLKRDPSHLQHSRHFYRMASQLSAGSPRDKFQYAIQWANNASNLKGLGPIEAYQTAINLLSRFIWLGATTNQRYHDLLSAQNLAVDAACAAILASNYPLALEWLEHARCVIWNQSLMLRSPLDQLHSAHPDLATHLQTVSNQLRSASSHSRESQALSGGSKTVEQVAQEHRRLAIEYDNLIAEARVLPGFEDFLQPIKANALISAARYGPIVVINCHRTRCDALVILPEQDTIDHIPLPNFTEEKAQFIRRETELSVRGHPLGEREVVRGPLLEDCDFASDFASVLGALWYDIVKPVLEFIGCLNVVPVEDRPHITWCPTGALSFLPLHAAGDYDQPGSKVFDYVISSYTPTVAALLASTTSSLSHNSRILAIGQSNTPGHSPLPGTTRELAYLKSHTQGKAEYTELVGDQATKTAVLDAMGKHDWVHLACHAHQNVHDPTESGFFLHDGALDLTSINQRSFKNKGLAYLSACQTAKGDKKLPDEAVHLASGMLMAGYSSVIATMWSVVDEDAPFVANKVYEQLMKDGKLGSGEAGKALHKAVTALRGEVGEREFDRWVPYIHIGS
ncbi:hypothetical protein FRC11_003238 [Ceratobasidium sp. 423]|nr:hypothetical protein FRC11_003238 [Ceratobasidium sp. 423]